MEVCSRASAVSLLPEQNAVNPELNPRQRLSSEFVPDLEKARELRIPVRNELCPGVYKGRDNISQGAERQIYLGCFSESLAHGAGFRLPADPGSGHGQIVRHLGASRRITRRILGCCGTSTECLSRTGSAAWGSAAIKADRPYRSDPARSTKFSFPVLTRVSAPFSTS